MLVVEAVEENGPGAKAGVQVGDRLLCYDGPPLPSPAALQALEENTFGKESLLLSLEREGQPLERSVPAGKLGIQTRPNLPDDLLAEYEAGCELFLKGEFAEAGQRWQQSARQADHAGPRAWLLSKAGEAWEKVPDWQQALQLHLAAWETLLEDGDTASQSQTATSCGRCHQRKSEWSEAVEWYQRAERIDGLAGRELWQARRINELGLVARYQGDLQTAHDYHTRALQIFERLAPDSLDVAGSLLGLGAAAWRQGDLQLGHDYFTRALQIFERLAPNSLYVASSLNNLGNVANDRGDLQTAQDYHARSLQIRERLAPDSLDVAMSLNNLGIVAIRRGDLQAAQNYYTRALQIKEHLAPNALAVAASLSELGIVARYQGDLQAAQDYHTRALRIRECLAPDSLDVAASLGNLGLVAGARGDLQAAQDYHIRVLQIRERLAPDSLGVAYSLGNLGVVAHDRGDLQAAQNYYVCALQIFERLAPSSLDVAMSLNNLGGVAWNRGDLQAAQDYYIRALQIRERLAPDSLDVAMSLNNLGTVAIRRGDLQAAQNYYTRALQIKEHLAPNSLNCAESLTDLGRTHLRQHHPLHAVPLLQQAVQILEQQRATINSPEARALLLAQHTTQYATLIECYLALNDQVTAYSTLERGRARSLLELLTERRLDFTADAPPQLLQEQQELDRTRKRAYDQLAQLSATPEDTQEIDRLQEQLRDLEHRNQQLTARIRQTSPHYASLQYPQPFDCKQAQALLDPGALLLSFLVDEEQTFLFALTRKQVHAFTLPVGRTSLQEQVRTFRSSLDLTALENRRLDAADRTLQQGEQLYQLLLGPAQEQIRKAKRLLLCADGPLHLLPWPALVVKAGKSPRYLGQMKPLSTTLSMTLLGQTREEARGKGEEEKPVPSDRSWGSGFPSQRMASLRRLLALGDPLYTSVGSRLAPAFARSAAADETASQGSKETESVEMEPTLSANADVVAGTEPDLAAASATGELALLQTRGLTLSPLPHSRQEVERIGQLFPEQAVVKLGAEATKTAVLTESGDAQVLHFACHGWLDARQPLSSALVFSQPEVMGEGAPDGDNGLLQVWEIFSKLKLDAELVVLSACQSGLGQEVRGEGLVGLTRAFTYAGARSVLVSLWKVHDESTSEFMQGFYGRLKEGKSKAEALRGAIQAMRRSKRYSHPFFWSAFLLQGE